MDGGNLIESSQRRAGQSGLSYKFQRLREKLRLAIASGQLAGKLPGERALAKQFSVNAKTLSKALTDLAAEGLLDRSIGRGTYVKGSAPAVGRERPAVAGRLRSRPDRLGGGPADPRRPPGPGRGDRRVGPSAQLPERVPAPSSTWPRTRPNRSSATWSSATCRWWWWARSPRPTRRTPCCSTGRWPSARSTRDLVLAGHRRMAAVEPKGCTVVAGNDPLDGRPLRRRSHRGRLLPAPTCSAMLANGITAFACQSVDWAQQVSRAAGQGSAGPCPATVSLVAIGSTSDVQPFSGYFLHRSEKVNAIVQPAERHRSRTARPRSGWPAGSSTAARPGPSPSPPTGQDHDGPPSPAQHRR